MIYYRLSEDVKSPHKLTIDIVKTKKKEQSVIVISTHGYLYETTYPSPKTTRIISSEVGFIGETMATLNASFREQSLFLICRSGFCCECLNVCIMDSFFCYFVIRTEVATTVKAHLSLLEIGSWCLWLK